MSHNDECVSANFGLYLNLDLFDIFVVDSHEREEAEHIDYYYEKIVARKDEGFVEVNVRTKVNHYPGKGEKTSTKNRLIEETEYEALAKTPSARFLSASTRKNIEQIKLLDGQIVRCQREISAQAPMCSACNTTTIQKKSKYGYFWGCPRYATCKARPIDLRSDTKEKLRELEELSERRMQLMTGQI